MRLAHVIPSYPQYGGVSAVIANLVDLSQVDGGPATDSVLTYQGDLLAGLSTARRRWYKLVCSLPWAVPMPADPVLAAIEALPPDSAIVTHGVFTTCCARVTALTRRRRPDLPRVAFPHDPYDCGLFGSRTLLKRCYWRVFERRYLRRADVVICLAPSHVGQLRDRGVTTPVVVTKLGLSGADVCAAKQVATRSCPDSSQGPRLLVLGRWDVYEKGLDLLCAALGKVAPDTRIRFVGPPVGAQTALAKLIADNRLSAAEPVGFVEDIWEHIAWADAVCTPSRKEGFGLAALQAMAAGRPVLLSSAAGLSEHVQGIASVVSVEPNLDSVTAGLRTLLESSAPGERLRVAAEACQQEIMTRFSFAETRRSIVQAAAGVHRRSPQP
jgi:glycosyltransferase involved in cell wall biosynthesis